MLINLNSLELCLLINNFDKEGAELVSFALNKLINLNYLLLHLRVNNIGKESVELLC